MKLSLTRKALTLIFLLTVLIVQSQTGTIRGFIYDKADNQPLFGNAFLEGTEIGASADVNGIFTLSKVPAGTYKLTISLIGYEPQTIDITVTSGEIISKKFYLEEASEELNEFIINAEKEASQTTIKMSVIKATKKDIDMIPTTGGISDIANYFQILPGVVSTGDQGGQLYVRGGSPIQNKVLLDGMVIYNPFHSIGFFSVFDTDIIRNADIYTGGFNAEYGGRISSVMDITTRDGNSNEFAGKLSVSPFGAKLLTEGPLMKPKKEGGSSISYLLSAKTSYLAQTSKVLYTYVDTAGLPFNFTDLYGKVSFNGQNGSKINLFGFNFSDSVKYQAISSLKWNSYGAGSNFVLVPTGNPVLILGDFSYSHYGISLDDKTSAERFSEVDGFNLGFDFKYFLKRDEIKYGIDVQGFRTNFVTYNSVNRKISQEENTTEVAGYVSYKFSRGVLLVEPSFRMHYYASLENFSPEPRLGVKYNMNENLRFKFASGIYSQNLISANSDRDVVNLFYGFLSGSDNLPENFVDENGNVVNRNHSLQKAIHYILGTEYDLGDKITINVEGYYKDFTQLTNINRNKIYEDDGTAGVPDVLKKDFIVETGSAMGVDFLAKYNSKKTYIWLTYSLGKVTRWDGVQEYPPIFDRRHNVNFVFTQLLGKNDQWEINARWAYGSALPFTPTQGYYQNISFEDITTDYVTANANDPTIIYGKLNSFRLSDYHRLDLTAKRRWEFKKTWKEEGKPDKIKVVSLLEAVVSVTNVYNRENIFYVDRVTSERVYQLPIIPALGINWSF
ncbi:MAG: TonB-dependent receptor [Bacteroidota bacterium]